jgi:phosphohistidine phosphatase
MSMQPQIICAGYRLACVARTLWLLRHGDAEPHGIRSDFDRRLTPRGERQARAAGLAFARLGVRFEHVFTSPRVRARDTALLACAELAMTPIEHAPLAGGFGPDAAAELLSATAADGRLLLVGHEPDLSGLVASMTSARIEMKKGGLAAIRGGELVELLRPHEIELVAGL